MFALKFFQTSIKEEQKITMNFSKADITEPKFSINGNNQEIAITAKEGNFLSQNKVLLNKNVIFKSKKFKIYGDNVIFNKKTLVASSNDKAEFVSKNALIKSIGFDITENGNIINFKGQTKLILK